MKILFITHQFFPVHYTGTERLTLDLANQIQRMGNFVTVLTYEPTTPIEKSQKSKFLYHVIDGKVEGFANLDEHIMKKEYQVESIPVISFRHTKHTWGFQIFDSNIEKYIPDIVKKFDVVHFTHPMRFASALKACKELGIPTVLTLTDNWLLCPRGLLTSNMQLCDGPDEGKKCMSVCHYDESVLTRYDDARFFFENVDVVFSGSEFVRNVFWQNDWKRRIYLNTFSVDYSHVKPEGDPTEIVFGFIGTLSWHKGPHVLLESFRKVDSKKIKLKIYGRGEEKDPYIKYIIEQADGDDRIEFCGTFEYENLPKIMKGISVIVIPSTYKENYPLVMQMALAYNKPVIVSKIGGMPEVVKDGVNAYLFEAGHTEQLAKLIFMISNDPTVLDRLKKSIVSPPRVEEEALRYENTYRELISCKK